MEGHGGEYEGEDHAWTGVKHDSPTADDIYVFECEEREEEVCAGYDESDCCWVGEAYAFELASGRASEGLGKRWFER